MNQTTDQAHLHDDGEKAPHFIDVHVGARVRLRRRQMGIAQQQLADALALTFQQVQKYENGANRISASKLYQIARKLEVPVAYFFEGLPEDGERPLEESVLDRAIASLTAVDTGIELIENAARLRRDQLKNVAKTVELLAEGNT